MWHLKDPTKVHWDSGHTDITAIEGKPSLFTESSALLFIISPLEGAILLQHVESFQLLHNIVTLGNPLLCLQSTSQIFF